MKPFELWMISSLMASWMLLSVMLARKVILHRYRFPFLSRDGS